MVAGCKEKMAEGLMTFVRNLTLICYCNNATMLQYGGLAQ